MIAQLVADPGAMIMLTGALVGIAASLVGTYLVLRGTSLLSDAISHSIVFGIIIVWLLTRETAGPVQIIGAALTGLLTVFLTETLAATGRVKSDAAIGLVFPVLFSIGVLLINIYARDVHIDEHTVLLGEIGFVWLNTVEIAGLDIPEAVLWMSVMTGANLIYIALFYKELKIAVFDPALAKALGLMPVAVFYGLLALTSGTAVAAFDSVGAILFIAFVIVPPSAAYLLTDRLSIMLVLGCLIAVAAAITGYWLAMVFDVSIGGMMAVMTGVALALAFVFGPRYGVLAQRARRRAQTLSNACRALAVHLYNHENSPDRLEENVASALRDHLHWPEHRARSVLLRALDEGLIQRAGALLELTDKGRAVAREILEPWSR